MRVGACGATPGKHDVSSQPTPADESDPVDVLIVGAGAAGAAVAWSLAETRMRIVCLEQGGWMRPEEYPSTRRDWEQLAVREFSPNPNIRQRPEDYPIDDSDSPISVVNFNGVGGSTVMYAACLKAFSIKGIKTIGAILLLPIVPVTAK